MGTLDDEGTAWRVSPGPELDLRDSCARWTHAGLLVGLRVKSGCAANPSGPGSSSQLKKMAVLSPGYAFVAKLERAVNAGEKGTETRIKRKEYLSKCVRT